MPQFLRDTPIVGGAYSGRGTVPAGGSPGQVLGKASGTSYDLAWSTPAGAAYSTTVGDGTTADVVVTHGLGTQDVDVAVREAASPYGAVAVRWEATTGNTVTLRFDPAPTTNQYRVTVMAGGVVTAIGGGAPTTSTYILQAADASLPNAQALGALATGLLTVATGTGVLSTAIAGTDYVLPTGDITGTAANVTGTVAVANGGTGATNATAAFNALSPMTTTGDLTTNDGTNDVRLAGNTTTTRKFLRQTGTGTVSAVAAWDTLVAGDIPALAESQVTNLVTDLASLAPLDSPSFTGRVSFNAHNGSWGTATDAATTTYDLSLFDKWKHTLGGNRTLALANVAAGQTFVVRLAQDATTGSRTVTWWSGITWMTTGGAVPALATAVNKVNVFSFVQTGTNAYDGFVVGSNA
jgi:hypothetical protein